MDGDFPLTIALKSEAPWITVDAIDVLLSKCSGREKVIRIF